MNGVTYCRVSSKEQIKGTSLESQELACQDFARSKNIKILKVFIERGESAKFADRTQLLELIDFCRHNKGKVQVLLVWKIDRFARNVVDHFSVKASLMKYGVRIVSVTEPIDANPEGKLMETILAGFAQFDNDIRAMRTVQGMRRKIQEGIFPWKSPLGYKSSTKNGEKKTEPDQPDQPLFGLLQKAWQEFATGAYTKAEIRRLMAIWGITTRKGKPMSPQSVDEFFSNRYYTGILVDPWSGEEHEGQHIPMVSREDFARVQQIIKRRNRSIPHQKERPEFPLRGLVRCSSCLRYMTGSFSRGRSRRYPYYHCKNQSCGQRGKSHPAADIHGEFEKFLDSVAPKPELAPRIRELVLQVAEQRQALQKTRRARVEADLAKINKESQELIRMRAQALITDQEFLQQKSLLSERRMAFEGTAIDENSSPQRLRERLDQVMEPLVHLRQTWSSLPVPLQSRFDRLLLPAGFVNGKSRTAELGLLFRVFQASPGDDSSMVPLTGKSWNHFWQEIHEFLRVLGSAGGTEETSK